MENFGLTVLQKVKEEFFNREEKFTHDPILLVKFDVTDEKSIEQVVQTTIDKWKTIDVLLNEAVIVTMDEIEEISTKGCSHTFDVNVRDYVLMAKRIASILKKSNVMIQFAFNIRLNSISPGSIDSSRRTQIVKDNHITI
ncbi:unnamed protein product [Adineta ricciae]|uniref:Uncharacterized protein n=1 Tax=Adineta ricciae TaxID=249248 RepID=A0A815CXR8_ADIRI|nr:unnamed protein product [Adineta ricciae]CAF1439550.1 unnamed protein product [Adineta ricciae]